MTCDKYLERLSARLDGALTGEEERELEAHLAICPDCRAAGAQLAALQGAFAELEYITAPEGFAQGVMDRIRAEEKPKVAPLFKRPQVRALAGLAACLVLAVGLYGAALPQKGAEEDAALSRFQRNVQMGEEDGPQVNASLADSEDAPRIAAYAAPSPEDGSTTEEVQKAAPNPAADGIDGDWTLAEITLILDRLPQGAEDILPPDAAAVYDAEARGDVYTWLTTEELDAIEKLAFEQGLIDGTTDIYPSPVGARCALIVRNG